MSVFYLSQQEIPNKAFSRYFQLKFLFMLTHPYSFVYYK